MSAAAVVEQRLDSYRANPYNGSTLDSTYQIKHLITIGVGAVKDVAEPGIPGARFISRER